MKGIGEEISEKREKFKETKEELSELGEAKDGD